MLLFVQVLYAKTDEAEHKATEKHQESLHWRMATCEICSVKYNSSTSLESHMEQSKHAKQLSKIKKMGMDAETLVCYNLLFLFMLNSGDICTMPYKKLLLPLAVGGFHWLVCQK